ncbi:MAG: 50S ribosomal protein L11 [Nanoarchaeota archaeon]|nr:50S ribosomal protein L11 [Nanoarchaeota archaeon]
MAKQTINALVEGGKASAGPPLGPTLGALKAPVPQIIQVINEKTKDMKGMQVPITIQYDTDTKKFEIEVGTPPVSALIKKELNLKKASGEAGKQRVGDLSEDQVAKVAKIKFGTDTDAFKNQVKGTARSMGVSIGKGAVTQEEIAAYEEQKKAEEAAETEKKEAKVAKEGEKKPEEKKDEKKEAPKKEEKKPEKKGK